MVAVDWPGHGLSSHVPPGARHCTVDYLEDIRYILKGEHCMGVQWGCGCEVVSLWSDYAALKWDKFSFLAHSMGEYGCPQNPLIGTFCLY